MSPQYAAPVQSTLIAAGAVILLVPLAILLWAVLTSMSESIDGPVMFLRMFGVLAVVVTVVAAMLAPNPGLALVVGLAVAGLIMLMFSVLS